MAKHKKEKTNKKNAVHVISSGSATAPATVMAPDADGQPLDKITYLEAKLILKPDRFTSVQASGILASSSGKLRRRST